MKDMSTYLTFDGNCRQAMEFYKKCLGGELFFMPVGESPVEAPKEAKDRIMHASLKIGSISLLAADSWMNQPLHTGNNFAICIVPESLQETKRLFAALSENGKVGMELQDTFWGAHFGMVVDQFGISWMLNFENPK